MDGMYHCCLCPTSVDRMVDLCIFLWFSPFAFARPYVPTAPWILAPHVKSPGYMVILSFCKATLRCSPNRILGACIRNDGFNAICMAFSGSYGLDIALSTQTPTPRDGLHTSVFVFIANTAGVNHVMGGCWLLQQGVHSRVAPNSSEQPKPGHQCVSPPHYQVNDADSHLWDHTTLRSSGLLLSSL